MSPCWAVKAFCIPVSPVSLEKLCDASDLVIVGRVGRFVKIGEVPVSIGQGTLLADLRESSVEIVEILKGDESAGSILVQVPVLLPPGGSVNLDGIPDTGVKLLFLRKSGDHRYQVTDPHHPSLPGATVSTDSGEPLERVAGVECQVISSDSASLNDKLDGIWSLSRVNSGCIVPALTKIASQRSPILSLTAEDELVKRDDTLILSQAIADALSERGTDPGYLKENILHSIGVGTRSPDALPLLDPLIKSSRAEIRLAAANALKNIGTQACVAPLRSLLSDSSQKVRYIAAIGLADIAGIPEMHPSIPEFQKNEGKYISYWNNGIEGR